MTFDEIVNILSTPPVDRILLRKWQLFARELNVSEYKVQHMQHNLDTDRYTHTDIMHSILEQWRSQMGSQATIEKLCEIFRNIDMISISDLLIRNLVPNSNLGESSDISVAIRPKVEVIPNAVKNESLNVPG